jgi:hypothetical protein
MCLVLGAVRRVKIHTSSVLLPACDGRDGRALLSCPPVPALSPYSRDLVASPDVSKSSRVLSCHMCLVLGAVRRVQIHTSSVSVSRLSPTRANFVSVSRLPHTRTRVLSLSLVSLTSRLSHTRARVQSLCLVSLTHAHTSSPLVLRLSHPHTRVL